MQYSQSNILSEAESVQIVQFGDHEHIGVLFKNLLLYFKKDDFFSFVNTYESIDFSRIGMIFPDEKKRMVMRTLLPDIQFCFTQDEFEKFKQALVEASIILRANSLIKNEC